MRNLILHYHILKNAGTTIDWILKRNFGADFGQIEGSRPTDKLPAEKVLAYALANPSFRAITSHQARLPLPVHPDMDFYPILFLRHPVDRIGSIYAYERTLTVMPTESAKIAHERDFRGYITWLLSSPGSALIRNFHCLYLSRAGIPGNSEGPATSSDLRVATQRLADLNFLGIVELFDESLTLLGDYLLEPFGKLDLLYTIQNKSQGRRETVQDRLLEMESQLGGSLFQELLEKNALDYELYRYALMLFKHRLDARRSGNFTTDMDSAQRTSEALRSQLKQRQFELDEIKRSRTWRAALLLQRLRTLIVPFGSLRERAIRRAIRSLRKLRPLILDPLAKIARDMKEAKLAVLWREKQAQRALRRLADTTVRLYSRPVVDSPTVSIIIPVHNQIEHTLSCLISIAAIDARTAYEIIVIDDASTDSTPNTLMRLQGIRYITNPENVGFVLSCNRAAAQARGSYLLFLNNDTRVHPSWLENLIETFSVVPGTGVVGSKLILPDGRLQEAGGLISADGSATNYGRGADPRHYSYNFARQCDYVSGASMLVQRALWEQLGGFDERYQPAYYEDVDFAFRVRQAGYKVIYQPFSEVTHLEGRSHGIDVHTGVKRYQVLNRKKFLDRWKTTLASHGPQVQPSEPARSRRWIKGKVLYIDDGTPRPDRYAGGLLSEFYLTTLNDAGYAVTFLPHIDLRYADGYTSELQRKGIMCIYQPYVGSSLHYIQEHGASYDYVVVCRANVAHDLVEAIRGAAPRAKIVFNSIDLHFLRFERAALLSGKASDLEMAARAKREELNVIRLVDCTLVVTAAEATLLAQLEPGARVKVVPFPADVHTVNNDFEDRRQIVFLGGFKHMPNVEAVLFFTKEIWPLLAPRLPNVSFVIAGADAPAEIRRLESDRIMLRGHVADLDQLFESARLSVAPIRFGAGLKGKIITSLGYGVPCVATTIAAEGTGLTEGRNILIADDPGEFADAVAKLYTSPDLWSSLSSQGQDWIRQNYARPVVAAQLLEVFSALEADMPRPQ